MAWDPGLTAALVAAAVALISLLVNLSSQRRADGQAARRAVLEPLRSQMAERVYSVVAYSVRSARAGSEEAAASHHEKARNAASSLDELRHALRYPLWGLSDALHALSLLPRWVDHARGQTGRLDELFARATALRRAVDAAVSYSMFSGNAPRWYHRCRARWSTWRLRRFFTRSRPAQQDVEL
jgi:hypothetical protein